MRSDSLKYALCVGLVSLAGVVAPACSSEDGGTPNGATSSNGGSGVNCGAGATLCGGECTVTALDPKNCGACGTACAAGEVCDQGSCSFNCSGGATKCGDVCVDMQNDPAHCGGCDTACAAGQEVCSAGKCASSCGAANLTRCGDACVDMSSNAKNCGKCGSPCAGAEECIESKCVANAAPKGVYTMSNDPSGNQIFAFDRAADGTLTHSGTFTATGGKGTGAGLGNQHGLIYDAAQSLFFAVNAGDNSISMLSLGPDGAIELLANVPSGGDRPISVTASGSLVYVVNAGVPANKTAGNISGFKISGKSLLPIDGSTQPLSAENPAPAQIQFSPDGKVLVVTEKGTSMLDTYVVTGDVAKGPKVKASAGQTPFGFEFDANQRLIVSEAVGGGMNLSTVSSYSVGTDGMLTTISGAVPTTRTAACWVAIAGSYAYVANAGSNDVTGLQIGAGGNLVLLNASGVAGQASMAPVDEDVTDGGDFLYVVNNGTHSLSIFQINADGSLAKKPDFLGLPSMASGIVAR